MFAILSGAASMIAGPRASKNLPTPLRRRSFLTAGLVSHYFPTDTDSFHYGTKQYV